ncbi:aminopeptidase P family protein [Kitasatospora purpeofusca]|uniref:aminopeptidase P family protein n=1 Tax=Kitasatospora purpeofusca TaxID=67352 RepID=UPI00225B93EE|nr:aminopeptidase P family protein [Kitasatospora purpeofusca]MCX4753396.1 aminopeptidase P family protein [Kitasatospora purpeofusca]WSR32900.1 aminopeptidase P family protein [Kitasatospora purpeofusca]WSR40993.1 aminopeptidase P family protein [Kitasatospora purpeofusca]WTA52331.1 aminopeptidase P family protein [Kitasatospora purpeofusca]
MPAPGESRMPRPFTAEDYRTRLDRATAAATAAGLAGLVVGPGPDLVHLTGYRPTAITERLTALVLTAGREPVLIVPALERPDAERAEGAPAVRLLDWTDGQDPYAAAVPLLDPAGRYGVSDNTWAMHLLGLQSALPGTGWTSLTETLPMLRAVKGPDELERLAAAGGAADAAYRGILEVEFAGRRETDVAADLSALLIQYGHSQVDFTVVGSGPNGANPHHEAGERIIGTGDTVVLDFGGLKDGYGSDTTRTVHVGTDVPDEVRKVHDVVRQAQQTAFEAVRPGIACQEIDRIARRVITEAGYGEYFIHRTGHGIGITTHEPPYLVEGEQQPLVPGMCFSIEPGVYLPGRFGVRIEDIVTVTEQGGRRFNNTPHELGIVS